MINFLSGAATLGFLVGAAFFGRFWRKTRDRLFAAFAAAFLLFAANQALSLKFVTPDDLGGSIYVLRVLGYVIILWAIIEKNLGKGANRER